MCTSHLAQHRVFVVWVLIVLFSRVDIEHMDSNADTAWELVFQILYRSEVLELKKVVSGKLGKSPLAATLSAAQILRFLLVTAEYLRGTRCDPLTPRRLHYSCKVDRTCRLPTPFSGLLSPAAIQALYSEKTPPCLHLSSHY